MCYYVKHDFRPLHCRSIVVAIGSGLLENGKLFSRLKTGHREQSLNFLLLHRVNFYDEIFCFF